MRIAPMMNVKATPGACPKPAGIVPKDPITKMAVMGCTLLWGILTVSKIAEQYSA
jgi:hypothetical protein